MTTAELWATWLTAGGTILAALVPGVLWFFERRDRRRAEAALRVREDQDRETARTKQARQVFVWMEPAEDERRYQGDVDRVIMHNASDLPVLDVIVAGYTGGRMGLEPGEDMSRVVLPGERMEAYSRGGPLSTEVVVVFRDSNDTIWSKDYRGNLTENPDQAAIFQWPQKTAGNSDE